MASTFIKGASANLESLLATVQRLIRDGLLSEEVAEKFFEKPYTIPAMIGVLKETKKDAWVTQFLLSSFDAIMEKFELLTGEWSARNTAVLPQIVALLGRLHEKGKISWILASFMNFPIV